MQGPPSLKAGRYTRTLDPADQRTDPMHELSIATNIVEIASDTALRERAARVRRVFVRIGPLSGVVPEALAFSFGIACEGTPCDGAELVVEDVPLALYCPQCRAVRPAASAYAFACPECGTPTTDVRQGRELQVTSIEILDEVDCHESAHR